MDDHGDERLVITEEIRANVLAMLREVEPDSHLVDCPDTVVICGDAIPAEPDPAGGVWHTMVLAVQCGHGHTSSRITAKCLATPDVPDYPPDREEPRDG